MAAQRADPASQHRIGEEAETVQFEKDGRVAEVGDLSGLDHVIGCPVAVSESLRIVPRRWPEGANEIAGSAG
jgi:hypothetical protein